MFLAWRFPLPVRSGRSPIGAPRPAADRSRRRLRRRLSIGARQIAAALPVIAAMLPALADGASPREESPAVSFDRHVECAAIFVVADERLHDADIHGKMSGVITQARQEAEAAGAAIGKPGEAVRSDIAAMQRNILRHFDAAASSSPDALKKEEADLGRVAIDCALLHVLAKNAR